MWFERGDKVYVSMPGVPSEMKTMMQNDILPRIQNRFATEVILHESVLVGGISESNLALKLADWENGLPACAKLSYLPQDSFIRLRLHLSGKDKGELERLGRKELESLEKTLKDHVIGFGEDGPAQVLVNCLRLKNLTLFIIEDGTLGALAAGITSVPGGSESLAGSAVALSDQVREKLTGIDATSIGNHGPGSRESAELMAARLRDVFHTDLGIATSAITTEIIAGKAVGTLWIAMASATDTTSEKISALPGTESFIAGSLFASVKMLRELPARRPFG